MSYSILDRVFPSDLISEAARAWPSNGPWVQYDTPQQRKRTMGCRRENGEVFSDWLAIPDPCRDLLRQMMTMDVCSLLGVNDDVFPDTLLWGAGLHEMSRGDFLQMHLDAARHPLTGLERRANAILFLSEWEQEWGGSLEFEQGPSVVPAAGRLAVFTTDDRSWHGVPDKLCCPSDVLRKTLTVYWWGSPTGRARSQAEFR